MPDSLFRALERLRRGGETRSAWVQRAIRRQAYAQQQLERYGDDLDLEDEWVQRAVDEFLDECVEESVEPRERPVDEDRLKADGGTRQCSLTDSRTGTGTGEV